MEEVDVPATPLPSGYQVLSGAGEGSRLRQALAASRPDADPQREGVRLLLAVAWLVAPQPTLVGFVSVACGLLSQLAACDPTVVADVALGMNLPGLEG